MVDPAPQGDRTTPGEGTTEGTEPEPPTKADPNASESLPTTPAEGDPPGEPENPDTESQGAAATPTEPPPPETEPASDSTFSPGTRFTLGVGDSAWNRELGLTVTRMGDQQLTVLLPSGESLKRVLVAPSATLELTAKDRRFSMIVGRAGETMSFQLVELED